MIRERRQRPEWLRWLLGDARFSSRRRTILAALVLLPAGAVSWFALRRAPVQDPRLVIEAVCDRLLPASGEHPGAIALGLHRPWVDGYGAHSEHLAPLVDRLARERFSTLDAAGQDAVLQQVLADETDTQARNVLRNVFRQVTRQYYTRPESWPALGYRQPQHLGYPEYSQCRSGKAA